MTEETRLTAAALVEAAKREIEEMAPEEVIPLAGDGEVLIVDVRDIRELERDGRIPGSFHCPRGMLEFWVDPQSPYYKPVFGSAKRYIFHCAMDWRSALATQTAKRMGLKNVANLKGGFQGWKKAGGPIEY